MADAHVIDREQLLIFVLAGFPINIGEQIKGGNLFQT